MNDCRSNVPERLVFEAALGASELSKLVKVRVCRFKMLNCISCGQ